ncbi:MAG: hypothetical protein ACQEXK_01210 [Bacillota bacterium]
MNLVHLLVSFRLLLVSLVHLLVNPCFTLEFQHLLVSFSLLLVSLMKSHGAIIK